VEWLVGRVSLADGFTLRQAGSKQPLEMTMIIQYPGNDLQIASYDVGWAGTRTIGAA
jgi:hypothetical protein